MKTLLLTWIVLFCGAHEVLSSPLRAKRFDAKGMEKDLESLNKLRQEIGKEIGVSMQTMVHDTSLDGIAAGFPSNCSQWNHGNGYRFSPLKMNENGQKTWEMQLKGVSAPGAAEKFNKATGQNLTPEDLLNGASFYLLEFFHPDQTKIGCAEVSCSATIPDAAAQAMQMNGNTVEFTGVCVVGPRMDAMNVKTLLAIAKSSAIAKMEELAKKQNIAKFLFPISLVLIISLF